MSDVTRILAAMEEGGDASAPEQLLPLVYEELRKLAKERLAHEKPGQTLQATALVHEAYVRLVDRDQVQHWNSRRHFYAAAAEAMRRILVERARHKQRHRHGGGLQRIAVDEEVLAEGTADGQILAVHDSLEALSEQNAQAAELVKLRFFGGMTLQEAAELLAVSPRTADRLWAYAKAWLQERLSS